MARVAAQVYAIDLSIVDDPPEDHLLAIGRSQPCVSGGLLMTGVATAEALRVDSVTRIRAGLPPRFLGLQHGQRIRVPAFRILGRLA